MEAQNLTSGNQVGSNEERRPINPGMCSVEHTMEDQNLTSANQGTGNNESELNAAGTTKKTRGIVYCRKLTTLPLVRNRTVIPVQVSGWDEIKPEALEHLWSVQAKSEKSRQSRAHQQMPHYNGTQSYTRLRHDFKEKYGKECSRLDLMLKSRTRTC